MTDNEIINGLLYNDREVCKEVVKRLLPLIYRLVLMNKGDRHDANDLFQETYIKAVLNLRADKYNQEIKFDAWFIRIARNIWIDYLRNKQYR